MLLYHCVKSVRIRSFPGPFFSRIRTEFPANLITFTEEILNEKLHFLCSVSKQIFHNNSVSSDIFYNFKACFQSFTKIFKETLFHIFGLGEKLTLEDFQFSLLVVFPIELNFWSKTRVFLFRYQSFLVLSIFSRFPYFLPNIFLGF